MMERFWFAFAALAGAAAAAGDVAARHLIVGDQFRVELGLIASRYGLWHALALIAVALLSQRRAPGHVALWLAASGWCLVAGQSLFSGSLYLLALGLAPWSGRFTVPGLVVQGWNDRSKPQNSFAEGPVDR